MVDNIKFFKRSIKILSKSSFFQSCNLFGELTALQHARERYGNLSEEEK